MLTACSAEKKFGAKRHKWAHLSHILVDSTKHEAPQMCQLGMTLDVVLQGLA